MNFIHNQTNQALADHVQFCAQNKILQIQKNSLTFSLIYNHMVVKLLQKVKVCQLSSAIL